MYICINNLFLLAVRDTVGLVTDHRVPAIALHSITQYKLAHNCI